MPKIDIDNAPTGHGTGYPEEFAAPCKPRRRWRLGDAVGLDQFGVNLLRLPAGAWSSQRHWHEGEDELVVMLSGEAVLVDDHGETLLRAGDVAAFPKHDGNGHVLQNRTDQSCLFVAIGRPADTAYHYPDIDMHLFAGADRQKRKDGSDF